MAAGGYDFALTSSRQAGGGAASYVPEVEDRRVEMIFLDN